MAVKVPTTRLGHCCRCCGFVISFLISHIGLGALVLAYATAGAFLFQYLESPHEQLIRNDTRVKRQQLLSVLWHLTHTNTSLAYEDWILKAQHEILTFEKDIIHAVKIDGYSGSDNDTEELQWSVAGAMMYSIIVITTIGYGNLAPKTTVGRIMTMLYAIAGIPLLRLFLSEVGDFMADTFKFLYWKVCYKLCIRKKHQNRHRMRRQTHYRHNAPDLTRSNSLPMTPISQHSPMLSSRSTPISETPFTEFGDVSRVPIICNRYALQADVVDAQPTSSEATRLRPRIRPILPPLDLTGVQSTRHFTISPEPPQVTLFQRSRSDWDSDSDSSDDNEEEEVPIFMCMGLVLAYICFGAWLFRQWEVDWSYLDSAYFCFVTLTTIGFGDMVPTAVLAPNSEKGRTTLIICALYLMFGMALLAMSFNAVQEAVSKSIKSTVRKVRLISLLETARRRDNQRRSRRLNPPSHFLPP